VRIAQIAPLHESIPPRCYGGTERVVAYLTEELVRRGHDVTLFASGDSKTSARLVPLFSGASPRRSGPIEPSKSLAASACRSTSLPRSTRRTRSIS
jgi:hypothetical protein